MQRKTAQSRKFNFNRKSSRSKASSAKRQFENLERRLLLASDFNYDHGLALQALDASLLADAVDIRLVRTSDNLTLHSVSLSDFTGVVNIKGSSLGDTLRFDPTLANLGGLKSVSFDGKLGNDSTFVEGNLKTNGQPVNLASESITVLTGVSISTRLQDASGVSTGDSAAITLIGKVSNFNRNRLYWPGFPPAVTFRLATSPSTSVISRQQQNRCSAIWYCQSWLPIG